MIEYKELIKLLVSALKDKKERECPNSVMVVGIEGVCSSGKSTLLSHIEQNFNHPIFQLVSVEGDLFHRGRNVVHSLYLDAIAALDQGYLESCNFHHLLTWKNIDLQNQLLDEIKKFNLQDKDTIEIELRNILQDKENGTEHKKIISLTKKSILVIPLVFLRHLENIDLIIYLDIEAQTSVSRKIERTLQQNINRNLKLTRDICTKLEYPTMVYFNQKIARKPDIIIDTNNWNEIKIGKSTASFLNII